MKLAERISELKDSSEENNQTLRHRETLGWKNTKKKVRETYGTQQRSLAYLY